MVYSRLPTSPGNEETPGVGADVGNVWKTSEVSVKSTISAIPPLLTRTQE